MFRKAFLALSFILASSPAFAQNTTCSDRPSTDSSNACANTRFVQKHQISPGNITLPDGQIIIGNSSGVGQGRTMSGDCTISDVGVISCTKNANSVINIAALRGVIPTANATYITQGYYNAGDGGGNIFYGVTGAPPGTYVDNKGCVILPTGGNGSSAWLCTQPAYRALQWGLVGDGVTDDSVLAQNFVDNNKGQNLTFDGGKTYLIGGLNLNGSTYNQTQLNFIGELKLKARVNAGDVNCQSLVFAGICATSVDGLKINGYFNGNRAVQYDIEQTFIISLNGVSNLQSNYLYMRELSGDGVYCTQNAIVGGTINSYNITLGILSGYNTTDAGRNLMSVISCDNVHIGVFKSWRIGGVVGGSLMPGGFDAESDTATQSWSNIVIGSADVVCACGSGITFYSSANNSGGAAIGAATVTNTSAPTINDGLGNLTITPNHVLNIQQISNVTVNNFYGVYTQAKGDALFIGNANNVKVNATVRNVSRGASLNTNAFPAGTGLTNSDLTINVGGPVRWGIEACNLDNVRINGNIETAVNGYYTTKAAVHFFGGCTQTNTVWSVGVQYSPNWTIAYWNDAGGAVSFVNTKILNADFGYSWPSYSSMMTNMAGVLVYNSPGYTNSYIGVPTTGTCTVGQYVKNGIPAVGAAKGWFCTVAGTPGTWVSEGNL